MNFGVIGAYEGGRECRSPGNGAFQEEGHTSVPHERFEVAFEAFASRVMSPGDVLGIVLHVDEDIASFEAGVCFDFVELFCGEVGDERRQKVVGVYQFVCDGQICDISLSGFLEVSGELLVGGEGVLEQGRRQIAYIEIELGFLDLL